jgi:hypothetical protein
MQEFFRSGLVADVVLAAMLVEALLLLAYRRITGRGLLPADIVVMLLAGACLVFALRAVLTGAQWPVVAFFLVAALVTHACDLYRRWNARAA